MGKFKVALVQLDVALGDKEANVKKAIRYIVSAAAEGAEIVCLPNISARVSVTRTQRGCAKS